MAENVKPLKRKVFYISGFDPRGAGHYHRLYKKHAALQSAVNGLACDISPRRKLSDMSHTWHIRAVQGADTAETDFEFLVWNDIVRKQWYTGVLAIARDLAEFFKHYVVTGLFIFFGRRAPQQLISGFYPSVFVALSLVLSFFAARGLSQPFEGVMAVFMAVAAFLCVFKIAMWVAEKCAAFWVLRVFVFSALWSKNQLPEVVDRTRIFAGRIEQSLSEGYDEVMVVSHSVGCMLAVPVLAEVLRRTPGNTGKISMVTLGQCIPLMSFQPGANDFRRDLDAVAHSPRVAWTDYTAKTDGACFPMLDFVTASGIARRETSSLKILSPRFFTLYSPGHYRLLRFNWYKMHFLYLLSTDYAGGYDYFSMTAGLGTLPVQKEGT